MTGMRDRLIHGYFTVDLDDVWNTLQEKFPYCTKVWKNSCRKISVKKLFFLRIWFSPVNRGPAPVLHRTAPPIFLFQRQNFIRC